MFESTAAKLVLYTRISAVELELHRKAVLFVKLWKIVHGSCVVYPGSQRLRGLFTHINFLKFRFNLVDSTQAIVIATLSLF
jgi:hypothetical protein